VREAEQLKSQQAHKNVEKALRRRVKNLTEELRDETTDWSLYARRLKKEIFDGKRETVAELWGFYAAEHLVWQEASREVAVLWKRCDELVELLDRVRNSRHGQLLAQVDRLVDQLRELKQRRTINARRLGDANLEARRAAVAMSKLPELQGQHEELWSSAAVDYTGDYPRLARRAQELEVRVKVLKAQLKAGDAEMAELRRLRLLAPPPPMAQGAYDAQMRLMAMELKGKANTCSTQVSCVIDIVARYYGIHIPERVKGKGDDARIIPYVPSPATCSRIRTEMGALSQLQVGEYIIEKGGSAGHFAIHSDSATSDGTEMSAFVLGQRSADATGASKIKNLMLELKSLTTRPPRRGLGTFTRLCSTLRSSATRRAWLRRSSSPTSSRRRR
jgi:hypothetical protein